MKVARTILVVLLLSLIIIQFFPASLNNNSEIKTGDISSRLAVPPAVKQVLEKACYDCHSNHTKYPWYAHVQPVGWLLAEHINDGKADLNFSEFASYPARRQASKLKAIASSIADGSMPLESYTWLHPEARLGANEKQLLISWSNKLKDSLDVN